MKRIAFVGSVGAGKTTLFNALQGNYTLARKTQAVEFNDKGDIDTPGEYFNHPRWYHALITTLQDVGSDSNLLIVLYVQIMPDDLVMQLHR
ncbi:EutP/PduV family microcompartment system protein, partial [Escherichia coli]